MDEQISVICPNCSSDNAEFIEGCRCWSCKTPLKASTIQEQVIAETEPQEEEDDIFCHMCDSQPHEDVVLIVKGKMDGINFSGDVDERRYYCNDCWNELCESVEKLGDSVEVIKEIF